MPETRLIAMEQTETVDGITWYAVQVQPHLEPKSENGASLFVKLVMRRLGALRLHRVIVVDYGPDFVSAEVGIRH